MFDHTRIKTSVQLIFIGILIAGITFSCQTDSKHKVLKLAHGLDQSHSVHKAMVFMAERLKEKSDGKLQMKIYPGGQLGAERECVELLQIGSLAITKVSSAIMEGFVPDYRVLGLPYIFLDQDHAWKVLNGEIGKELLVKGDVLNLRGLCFYDAGSRSFYTKEKPINNPEDLKGLKIRVMKSNTAVEMVKALGGSPTPISWGELYTALQGGVVDGAENNPPSFFLSHHYEVCKYYSLDEHTSVPDVLLMSSIIWKKLTPQEKKWLQEAADESVPYQRELWAESVREALDEVTLAGVEIIHPDKTPFVEKVYEMIEGYKEDEELYSLISRIREVK